MKIFSFILALFIFSQHTRSQSLQGHVVDEESNPVYSAAVVLLSSQDSSFVQATITDSLGRYELPILEQTRGIVKITHFAYNDYFLTLNLNTSKTTVIPEIRLKTRNFELGEIIVKANPPQLTRKADHFSFNVVNTDLVKGNNTWNVLKFTPFLNVDDNSGINMIGKGQVTIYINGRKNHFDGISLRNYLESLPAEEIQDIQIMTNASSKFRADETSGIINIVLRKKELEGVKGNISFTDRQSDYKNYGNTNGFLNYRKNRLDLSTNIFAGKNKNLQTSNISYSYANLNSDINAEDRSKLDNLNYGLKVNMDYHLSPNKVLGIMIDASMNKNENKGENHNYYRRHENINTDSMSVTTRENDINIYHINMNINYYQQLKNKNTLSADLNFLKYRSLQDRATNTDLLTAQQALIRAMDRMKQRQEQNITNGSGKIDFELNASDLAQMKTGVEVYTTYSDADELYSNQTLTNPVQNQANYFSYKETISAAYLQISKEWEKISAMIGARLEYGYGRGKNKEKSGNDFTRNSWDLFPSFSLNYLANESNELSLSFSSGIRRPEFVLLNPFKVYTSEISYRENNPFLKNMKTYNINLTYVLKSKYIVQLTHFRSRDAWSLFRIPEANSNITKERFDNYGKSSTTNLSLMWNESLFNGIWYIYYSIGGYYGKSKGNIENMIIDVSSYVPNIYLSNSITILKKWPINAEITYYFMGKEKMASIERQSIHNLNINLSKQIKNIRLNIGVSDILNSKVKESFHTGTYNYRIITNNNRRNYWVSISYNFGNMKVKGARNRKINTEINKRIN